MMDEQLSAAKQLYDEHVLSMNEKGTMAMHKNMPLVSGRLQWVRELRQRIALPMTNFRRIEHA